MKAYELLSSPKKWLKGCFAKDIFGVTVRSTDPLACKWCVVGAINRCYPEKEKGLIIAKVRNRVNKSIMIWNDTSTYEEVIAVLKELDI